MPGYRRALVALDLGDSTAALLASAQRSLAPGGELLTAHVIEPMFDLFGATPGVATAITTLDTEALKMAERAFAQACESAGVPEDRRYLLRGHPAPHLLTLATEEGADLIVVGSHRKRGLRALLGSTATELIHQSPCDVLIVRIP
jgi:universal stress protein A